MNYIQAIKIGVILAILASIAWALEHDGYKRAENKYQLQIKVDLIKQQQDIAKLNELARAETERATMLAQTIEVKQNEAQQTIDKLAADNVKLLNTAGVHKRSVCVENRVPEDNSTVVAVDPATTGGLSKEAEQLLFSEIKRADDAAVYANTAYDWAKSLCGLPGVACPALAPDKLMEPK